MKWLNPLLPHCCKLQTSCKLQFHFEIASINCLKLITLADLSDRPNQSIVYTCKSKEPEQISWIVFPLEFNFLEKLLCLPLSASFSLAPHCTQRKYQFTKHKCQLANDKPKTTVPVHQGGNKGRGSKGAKSSGSFVVASVVVLVDERSQRTTKTSIASHLLKTKQQWRRQNGERGGFAGEYLSNSYGWEWIHFDTKRLIL